MAALAKNGVWLVGFLTEAVFNIDNISFACFAAIRFDMGIRKNIKGELFVPFSRASFNF